MSSLWKPNRPNGRGTIEKTGRFGWRWSIMISRKRHVGADPTAPTRPGLALGEVRRHRHHAPEAAARSLPLLGSALGDGHTKKRCSIKVRFKNSASTTTMKVVPAVPVAPVAPVVPVVPVVPVAPAAPIVPVQEAEPDLERSMSRMKIERRRCSICDERDHQSNRCPKVPEEAGGSEARGDASEADLRDFRRRTVQGHRWMEVRRRGGLRRGGAGDAVVGRRSVARRPPPREDPP